VKHPRQIWILFGVAVCIAIGGLAWLTVKALEIDRAELAARLQAQQEADIGLALWRMDGLITPVLAQEAVRPHWAFESSTPGSGQGAPSVLSPLIRAPDGIRLHFVLTAQGVLTSPQFPQGPDAAIALKGPLTEADLAQARTLCEQLQKSLDFAALQSQLPTETLPPAQTIEQQTEAVLNGESQSLIDPNAKSQNFAYSNSLDTNGPQSATSNSSPRVDLENRGKGLQNTAQIARSQSQQRQPLPAVQFVPRTLEGVSRPLWVGSKLVIARQTHLADSTVIEGCWLDWELIERRLKEEVHGLLPQVELQPVRDVTQASSARLLATLPVELRVPSIRVSPEAWSPLRIALLSAWAGLILAGCAATVMLRSVVALSERRAAFVSAVTHELRTPLTTFRLYADMLSSGMVPEPARQQEYLETLRREADRLAQLVDNVLLYARLERNRHGGRTEQIAIGTFLERVTERLSDRARQCDLKLELEFGPHSQPAGSDLEQLILPTVIETDPAAVEQILFNLIDNACKYAAHTADRRLHLGVVIEERDLWLTVRDHGPGIPPEAQRRLFQPFSRPVDESAQTAPGVGLGLALCHRLASELGGRLQHDSACPEGACFRLRLRNALRSI